MTGEFWSAHTHTQFSAKDALPTPAAVVDRAVELGYPALGITDHGSMGGIAQAYKAASKHDLPLLPGIEAYIAVDREAARPVTMHMGLLAYTDTGYRNLVALNNQAQAQFKYKPILDLADLAGAAEDGATEGIAVMTGCWFGLLPTLMRGDSPSTVRNIIRSLGNWFPKVYVEIQNHLIHDSTHDDSLHALMLQAIADSLSMPTVITQDSHYCHDIDRKAHETMKRLVSWSDDPDDAVFPGDGYHMVDTEWMRDHHIDRVFSSGMEGLADLANAAKVRIKELDSFQAAIPDVTPGGDPDFTLKDRTRTALTSYLESKGIAKGHKQWKEYHDRLDVECEVISFAGFSGYLLFTAKVCDWIRDKGIAYNIRGSASGSLLCFLLGITRLDPVVWSLPFERFLSTDRTSMPDIDIDVEDARRDEVLEMLDSRYTTARISTWLKLGLDDKDEYKGSLIVKWKQQRRRTGQDPNVDPTDVEMDQLRVLAAHKPLSGMSVHAAGVVVAPDEASMSGLPLSWVASSKTMVTAFPMKDVEAMGLVKLDILGLKTLTALKTMGNLTGIDPFSVPLDDPEVFRMISRGEVDGVFQLEGRAARAQITDLSPKNFNDIVLAVALFRPATLQSGATRALLDRRRGREKVIQRHPVIMKHTKDTKGVLIFQEQAMELLREFGLPIEDIEKARKAIKASNANVGDAGKAMDEVITKVKANATDLSDEDVRWLGEVLHAYAGYSFNRAHATAYGQVAYITGWFKVHHPAAFWVAQLDAYVGDPQESDYLRAARKSGVSIRPAHVNMSGATYTADLTTNAIRRGLTSVKGVGNKAATELAEKTPFATLADLATRVNARAVTGAGNLRKGHSPEACGGVIAALADAGALEGLASEINPVDRLARPIPPRPRRST